MNRLVLPTHTTMDSHKINHTLPTGTRLFTPASVNQQTKCRLFLSWWFTIRAVPIDDKWWSVNWLNESHLNWMLYLIANQWPECCFNDNCWGHADGTCLGQETSTVTGSCHCQNKYHLWLQQYPTNSDIFFPSPLNIPHPGRRPQTVTSVMSAPWLSQTYCLHMV